MGCYFLLRAAFSVSLRTEKSFCAGNLCSALVDHSLCRSCLYH